MIYTQPESKDDIISYFKKYRKVEGRILRSFRFRESVSLIQSESDDTS